MCRVLLPVCHSLKGLTLKAVCVSEVVLAAESVCVSAFMCLRLRQCVWLCASVVIKDVRTHKHTHTDTQTAHQSQIARTPDALNSSGVASNENTSLIDPLRDKRQISRLTEEKKEQLYRSGKVKRSGRWKGGAYLHGDTPGGRVHWRASSVHTHLPPAK